MTAVSASVPNRVLLPLIVACALFMENLDSTVLSTALPTIAADFGESPIRLKLALTSYLLALAVFIPTSGWIADRFGARHVFRIAIGLFTLGSLFCGLSSGIGEIVAARVLQGIGGAMMVPVGRLVILRSVEKSELVGALAWLTIPALVGPVLGPPLGGFITTNFDWRWIFWINIPIGILGIVLATVFFPDIREEERTPFDAPGFFISGIGLAAFVTGTTSLGLGVLPLPLVMVLLFGGLALLVLYYFHARRAANPILDLTLLRLPTFRGSILGGFLFRLGAGATPFLLPLMLQLGFGMSPFQSGMITFASAVGAMAMKIGAGPILRRFGFRAVLIFNALVAACFVASPALFTPATPVALIVAILLVGGFFRSLEFTAINALAYAEVPTSRMSRATSLTSVFQQLALSAGISIGAMVLEFSVGSSAEIIRAADFLPAFAVVGLLTASSILFFARLPADAGQEMSGHQRPTLEAQAVQAREGS